MAQLQGVAKHMNRQQKRANTEYKQLFLVYAQDCKSGKEHLLNSFEKQSWAEQECLRWQAKHREWYKGFNNFTLFVKGMYLNKPGQGGVRETKLFILSADWE